MASQEKTLHTDLKPASLQMDSLRSVATFIRESVDVLAYTRQLTLSEWQSLHHDLQNATHHLSLQAIHHTTDVWTHAIRSVGQLSRLALEELAHTSETASGVWQQVVEPLFQQRMLRSHSNKPGHRTATVIPITIQDN